MSDQGTLSEPGSVTLREVIGEAGLQGQADVDRAPVLRFVKAWEPGPQPFPGQCALVHSSGLPAA